jgi:hypothetical protein
VADAELDRLAAVGGVGDDLEVRQAAEDGAQAGPHERMIVGQNHPVAAKSDLTSSFAAWHSGNDAAISVPLPDFDVIEMVPPASATRSRMLSRPRRR